MNESTNCQFSIEGELTIYTAADTKARLLPLLAQCSTLEIDLSQVSELDSAGVQLLLLAQRECEKRNGRLHLHGHSAAVSEALEMCNLTEIFAAPALAS